MVVELGKNVPGRSNYPFRGAVFLIKILRHVKSRFSSSCSSVDDYTFENFHVKIVVAVSDSNGEIQLGKFDSNCKYANLCFQLIKF